MFCHIPGSLGFSKLFNFLKYICMYVTITLQSFMYTLERFYKMNYFTVESHRPKFLSWGTSQLPVIHLEFSFIRMLCPWPALIHLHCHRSTTFDSKWQNCDFGNSFPFLMRNLLKFMWCYKWVAYTYINVVSNVPKLNFCFQYLQYMYAFLCKVISFYIWSIFLKFGSLCMLKTRGLFLKIYLSEHKPFAA